MAAPAVTSGSEMRVSGTTASAPSTDEDYLQNVKRAGQTPAGGDMSEADRMRQQRRVEGHTTAAGWAAKSKAIQDRPASLPPRPE